MAETVKILIADDHQMFIDGVKSLLRKEKNFVFVHDSNDGEDAFNYVSKNDVDLLITDISMPHLSGTELTIKVKQNFPHIKVLVLTMFNDRSIITEILQAEAEGYILKNTGKNELINAITRLMDNGTFYSSEVLNTLLSQTLSRNKIVALPEKHKLTSRELEILKLICDELTTADISKKLFISPRTVDTHRKNIIEKSGAKTIVGLIKYAFENNIIQLNI